MKLESLIEALLIVGEQNNVMLARNSASLTLSMDIYEGEDGKRRETVVIPLQILGDGSLRVSAPTAASLLDIIPPRSIREN